MIKRFPLKEKINLPQSQNSVSRSCVDLPILPISPIASDMSIYNLGIVNISWLPEAEEKVNDDVKRLMDDLYHQRKMSERLTNPFGNIYRLAISGANHRGARAILQRTANDHMVIVETWPKSLYGIGNEETDERTYSGYLNHLRDLHNAENRNE